MRLPRPVWLLGWVSLFTDLATEMTYPLLPLFLTRALGAGALSLGIIEGAAEAANSALKVVSGWLADRRTPKPLVLAGYALSSAIRPLMALVTAWPHVLAIRLGDRLGKGIRGAPRDAMLAHLAPPGHRGRIFGFHRAMDHAGAIAGPLVASLFLFLYPEQYRPLFALTLVPGILVILILLRVPDTPPGHTGIQPSAGGDRDAISTMPRAHSVPLRGAIPSRALRRLLAIILVFSLGNASDAFLLLRLSDLGIAVFWIPLLWSALHAVKATSSLWGGTLSDRLGRRTVIALGWSLYALVYAGFGLTDRPDVVVAIFLSYGLYFGLTEGVEKAWVADLVAPSARGTAFGFYNAVLGLGALLASLLFGFVWTMISPQAAFFMGAALAAAATGLLYFSFPDVENEENPDHQ